MPDYVPHPVSKGEPLRARKRGDGVERIPIRKDGGHDKEHLEPDVFAKEVFEPPLRDEETRRGPLDVGIEEAAGCTSVHGRSRRWISCGHFVGLFIGFLPWRSVVKLPRRCEAGVGATPCSPPHGPSKRRMDNRSRKGNPITTFGRRLRITGNLPRLTTTSPLLSGNILRTRRRTP